MSSKRTIFIEAAMVIGFLGTGLVAAEAAHAAQSSPAAQTSADPRANIKIESKIQVERSEEAADGKLATKYYAPADVKVIPGDKLVFINSYKNTGNEPVSGFVVNNPVHAAVEFTGAEENWAELSVDGGASFGDLAAASVANSEPAVDGTDAPATRPATLADVTHIRWNFKDSIPAGASGKLTFRGVVK